MRISMAAQSCDSVPPAPGLIVTMALRCASSPRSMLLNSRFLGTLFPRCLAPIPSSDSRSVHLVLPRGVESFQVRSSTSVERVIQGSVQVFKRLLSSITFLARSWSLQKFAIGHLFFEFGNSTQLFEGFQRYPRSSSSRPLSASARPCCLASSVMISLSHPPHIATRRRGYAQTEVWLRLIYVDDA